MRHFSLFAIVFTLNACQPVGDLAARVASAVDELRDSAENYCGCLPQDDNPQCLEGVTSMDDVNACIEQALDTADIGADVEGFVDCYESSLAGAEQCVGAEQICAPETISSCIAASGLYNCSAPAELQTLIDQCLS